MATSSPGPVVVGAEHLQVSFDAAVPPALEIEPGARIAFETSAEIFRRLAAGETFDQQGLQYANAVTGPVRVRGAEPGDALRIEVLEVEIADAWIVRMPGFGPLAAGVDGIHVTAAPVRAGRVFLAADLSVPLEPMIGCIGVAPADGAASTMRPVYRTGGNLDLRELSPGAVLWLPVEVEGALLCVGDLHAAMGRGEPAFIAIESSGRATLRIDLEKHSALAFPRLRTAEGTVVVGMGTSFPAARESAVEQAYALLIGEHGLAPETAYAYVCACVELRPAGPSGSTVEGMEAVAALVPDPR